MTRFYFSPEQYRHLIKKDDSVYPKNTYDMTKSDVYTLGLIMLELGLMESNNCIYKEYDIDQKVVQAKLRKFGATYPQNNLVKSVLYKMLQYDPTKRPDFIEIQKRLPAKKDLDKWFSKNKDKKASPQFDFSFNPGQVIENQGKYVSNGPDIFAGDDKSYKIGLDSGFKPAFRQVSPDRNTSPAHLGYDNSPYSVQKRGISSNKKSPHKSRASPTRRHYSPKYQLSPKKHYHYSPNRAYTTQHVNYKGSPYKSPNR